MAATKRIMMVSWGLPPSLTGSSVIADNLARQFGADEMILAGQAWTGAESHRRAPGLPRLYYLNKEWTWPRRGQKYVRWMRWTTRPGITRRLMEIARKENCTAIIGVFPDEFFLYASYVAAKKLGLPFYPFFHNTYIENRTGSALRFAQWLEPRVFADAPAVIVANDGMKDYYEPRYPNVRFASIGTTFYEPIPDFTPQPPVGNPLKLAFVGNLNESNVDAACRLGRVINRHEDYTLTTYSGTLDWFFAKVGLCGPRITHTRVAPDQVTTVLKQYDIVLLPHGLTGGWGEVEYATIFPVRTVSLLLSLRPIMAHSPPECFLTRFLRKHDCAEIVDQPDEDAVERAIERLRNDPARREQLVRNALTAVRQFHAPVVAGQLRQLLVETMPATTRS